MATRTIRDFDDDLNGRAATHYADIVTSRERVGQPISTADGQIAAICRASRGTLATRNVNAFVDTGVDSINPWDLA